MRCFFAVVFAVILVAAQGKVVPASDVEAQQTSTSVQLSQTVQDVQNYFTNLVSDLSNKFSLPNQEEFLTTMRDNSHNFVNNVQSYMKNVSDEIKAKNPELENMWTNMTTKLSEMVDKLTVNNETSEQITQLRTKLQEGVQTILQESENAAKTISENSGKVQEELAKFTKDAIDLALHTTQNLNNQLQQAATPQN